ncbi:glycosyltransferase family 4 protein [Flavobacterium sp.]|uniref:glycosyltransferase family 4 protein n=1 Tax=Flavobacterium sp. TaxID=239 RepID=UPI002639FBD5|nr:glycosyltransferase family 4 protein [Flavobacterium sp.]
MTNRVLFIGQVWPEPASSAAGYRILQLMRAFAIHNYEVHFATAAEPTQRSADMHQEGVVTHRIALNSSTFQEFVKVIDPSVVVYDRYYTEEQFSWRVREVSASIIHVLDTEDLHFLRADRDETSSPEKEAEVRNRELASIYRSDLSLIISSFEQRYLMEFLQISGDLLAYLPFWQENYQAESNQFDNTADFYFIGNLSHKPNTTAVHTLARIWHEIKLRLPQAELFVYGNYVPQALLKYHSPEQGFHLAGAFDKPLDMLRAHRVLLAPLSFGAGLKGKIYEAMLYGIPFVSTVIGVEGFELTEPNEVTAADDADFVLKAVALYSDVGLWHRISRNLQSDFEMQFGTSQYIDTFFKQLNIVMADLELHRRRNPVGDILRQQAFSAAKYLSKYIEQKNR